MNDLSFLHFFSAFHYTYTKSRLAINRLSLDERVHFSNGIVGSESIAIVTIYQYRKRSRYHYMKRSTRFFDALPIVKKCVCSCAFCFHSINQLTYHVGFVFGQSFANNAIGFSLTKPRVAYLQSGFSSFDCDTLLLMAFRQCDEDYRFHI